MKSAIFFSGLGTAFHGHSRSNGELELYPGTLPALRFLARRGYRLILVAPERQEYRTFLSLLKDKSLDLTYCNPEEARVRSMIEKYQLNAQESFFITDGLHLKSLQNLGLKVIIVLSGNGFSTLSSLLERVEKDLPEVAKDFYGAAFSIVLSK